MGYGTCAWDAKGCDMMRAAAISAGLSIIARWYRDWRDRLRIITYASIQSFLFRSTNSGCSEPERQLSIALIWQVSQAET